MLRSEDASMDLSGGSAAASGGDVEEKSDVTVLPDMPLTLHENYDTTVLVFDWDDTLLCSSWLASNGLRLDFPDVIPAATVKQLEALQASVISLLARAKMYGKVMVITNAETGWVEMSAKRFMPDVLPSLVGVDVFSARTHFESLAPDNPSEWKVHAFHHKISAHYGHRHTSADVRKHVVSFGDSIHERHAIHRTTARMKNAATKSVKFVERPNVEQLKRQVDLVSSCFKDIASHTGDLDLMLTIQLLYNS